LRLFVPLISAVNCSDALVLTVAEAGETRRRIAPSVVKGAKTLSKTPHSAKRADALNRLKFIDAYFPQLE
jgi:hypothetical protein